MLDKLIKLSNSLDKIIIKCALMNFEKNDLKKVFDLFLKEENFIGSGTNNHAYRLDDTVALFSKEVIAPIKLGKVSLEEAVESPEIYMKNIYEKNQKRSGKPVESSEIIFKDLSSVENAESYEIAYEWRVESSSVSVQIMKYLGDTIVRETEQEESGAIKVEEVVFPIIKNKEKVMQALDIVKKITDNKHSIDPKSDNFTIMDGKINFIDINSDQGDSGDKNFLHFIQGILPTYILRHHSNFYEHYSDIIEFLDFAYSYGNKIGLNISANTIDYIKSDFYNITNEGKDKIKKDQEDRAAEKLRKKEEFESEFRTKSLDRIKTWEMDDERFEEYLIQTNIPNSAVEAINQARINGSNISQDLKDSLFSIYDDSSKLSKIMSSLKRYHIEWKNSK